MPSDPSSQQKISSLDPLRDNPFFEWLVLAAVMCISFLINALVMGSLMPQLGIADLQETLANIGEEPNALLISALRILQAVGQFFLFTFPALLYVGFMYRNRAGKFLHLNKRPGGSIILGAFLLVLAFPLTQIFYYLNQQIPTPDWMGDQGELSQQLVAAFLNMDKPSALYMNLLAMALLPAVGEELIFRGIVQKLVGKATKKAHYAIWVSAALFSFIHMEFDGFIPRLLLGALLGYLLYWTNNLWVPILAHFVHNAFQIFVQYAYQNGSINLNLEEMEYFPLPAVVGAGVILVGICYWWSRSSKEQQQQYENAFFEDLPSVPNQSTRV